MLYLFAILFLVALNAWQLHDRRQLWASLVAKDDQARANGEERDGLRARVEELEGDILVHCSKKESLAGALEALNSSAANAQNQILEAKAIAVEAEAKTARYFTEIESACKQRDHWGKLYQDMSSQYGNAQDLMLRTIDGLARQLEAVGKKPKVPRVIQAVRDDFFERHVHQHSEAMQKAAVASQDIAPERA